MLRFPRLGIEDESRRRVIALYVAAIVGPTLVILYLGIQAIQRQRHAIEQLSQANRQLRERTLATTLEQRLTNEADVGLREASELIQRRLHQTDWREPRIVREVRVALAALAGRHPIAKATFLVEDGIVRVPKTQLTLPRPLTERLGGTADAGLVSVFEEAEALERSGRLRDALSLYKRIHTRAKLESTAAAALSRMARCHEQLADPAGAADLHYRVMEEFPEAYDDSGRPHALVAAVEWQRIGRPQHGARPRTLLDVQRALASGRWELDPDAAEYFAAELSIPNPDVPAAPYLKLTALARALEGAVPTPAESALAAPQRVTLQAAGDRHDIYYRSHRAASGVLRTVGMALDREYVRTRLLPEVASASGIVPESATLQDARGAGTELRDALPGMELVLAHTSMFTPKYLSSDVFVFGGAVAVVLSVLLFGVVLLLRDVARDASTSRLRSDLVGGVSHELKTPLTAIRMYGETLAARPEAPVDVRRNFYDVIVQESDRLARLVDRVLDFSQVGSGRREYVLTSVPVLPLVEGVIAQYRPFLHQQGFAFELVTTGPAISSAEIQADREAVTRALVNLLDNAVKYSEDDRWIRVDLSIAGDEVTIGVHDRGIGVPAAEREQIFRKFSRGGNRSGRGGYGLGLYLVKHVMDAHRGRVEVWSDPGRGSRFTLVFPLADDPAPAMRQG